MTIPLPSHLDPPPPRLSFKQVQDLVKFWNQGGGRSYIEDLRACGVLRSVTPWPTGKRARYDTQAVLSLYAPVAHDCAASGLNGHGGH